MKNVLIIGAIIVLALAAFFFFTGDDGMLNDANMRDDAESLEETAGTNDADGNGDVSGPQNRVVLAESETGNFATVGSVTLTQPGFVAIYKVNSNGATTLIGNTDLLTAGTHGNIQVQLDTVIAEEETIVATLHADDGDGDFEYPGPDLHLGNDTSAFVSDVDVVDVPLEDENAELQEQVELYIEQNMDASASDEDLEVN